MNLCRCGCGTEIPALSTVGIPQRFVLGHNARLQPPPPLCSVSGCDRKAHAQGMCGMHRMRLLTHGHTGTPPRKGNPVVRFWANVQRGAEDECWEWAGGKNRAGYGEIGKRGGVTPSGTVMAHRAAYELATGETVPRELHMDHLCRNPPCCNPAHLEPVTVAENVRRGLNGVLRTHCRLGHPLTGTNLYVRRSDNSRHCRTCRRDQCRARRAAGRAS